MSASENSNANCSGNKCPCQENCPLASALAIIGGKWKIPIICSLYNDGPTRYNNLKRKIIGVTNTMLASSLKELEADGIVLRTQYNEMPLRVEYELTKSGNSIIPILEKLAAWGKQLGN